MSKTGFRGKYGRSPSGRTEDSHDSYEHRRKKRQNRLPDSDFSNKFPVPPPIVPPGFNQMVPPLNPVKGMPMIVPGMPLPPPILMNMPLPPPDSDPEEIKKALKMIMSNFPVHPPKDGKLPFPPTHKHPSVRKRGRRDSVPEHQEVSNEELFDRQVDKLLDQFLSQDDFSFSLTQIPGLVMKRFLKSSTINEIERRASRRNQKVRFLDHLDIAKLSSALRTTCCSPSLEKTHREYQSLGLGKVEGVLPFVDGLE
ncbi:conserved hypothetical protein [Theileria orientalis strain Shintoku]|uniref:Uncharacterized protein n=1 Tax=Theileria orientalis strain Shintoku TaxID=869250 RepID=J7MEJ4_THEOR|nr:conserved hypothetical protein [Theileria orientalis strain Shintoku]PVC50335.1 hypothetical protein MACL_00002362 [Theileria orientalis]BAM38604.1 conserved hypothetical protein [Theileria orientalis strain Shintoku]|eukprot:XP_009688905.1 conserved hypothetical protein [Theileria orientalis strain Shintoku]